MFLLVGADDEKEFDYVKGGDKGPDRWGEIHEEWSMCKHGNMQSPIDLLNERVEVVSHFSKEIQALSSHSHRDQDMMIRKTTLFSFIYLYYEQIIGALNFEGGVAQLV